MPLWNNNDSEASKPNWLTEEQKRMCFRTERGWEIPVQGFAINATAENIFGGTAGSRTANAYSYRSSTLVGPTELLVAMPYDPSITGARSPYSPGVELGVFRGRTSNTGYTAAGDLPNYAPYFTSPATGQNFSISRGTTAYIPVIGADVNMTDMPRSMSFSITGPTTSGLSYSLVTGVTAGSFGGVTAQFYQSTTLTGAPATASGLNRFGGLGGITQGAALFSVGTTAGGPTGVYAFTLSVNDGRATGSLTGSSRFTITLS